MIKKEITLPNAAVGHVHVVRHVSFTEDGGCVADVVSFASIDDACQMQHQLWSSPVRCDGVSQSQNVLEQVYGVLAQDAVYGGYIPISPDAQAGLDAPIAPRAEKPVQPTEWHHWDKSQWAWVVSPESLEAAKISAKERITLARNADERAGFLAYGKLFDSDDKSIQRLLSAAQAAANAKQFARSFSVVWTCADNSTINLNEDQLIELPNILVHAGDLLHQKARHLKSQIDSSTTLEEVMSVSW